MALDGNHTAGSGDHIGDHKMLESAQPISILDCGGVADGSTPNDTAWATMVARMKAG